ncbi:mediator of RNA polymerase II transcription subunit 15a-like [Vicia villosa]|uniref:mediator of RNA polymerase II transcription subunit 15a-like n=1 Tax=Vicia villosa TaxID=3911 RepID=UPI00273BD8AA|nr:mediator of RNA polymerase II transcription subunit 15a-like [Vicia villosa]
MDSNNQDSQPTLDTIVWRPKVHPESRKKVVNKITDTLQKFLPVSGNEGLHELQTIAQKFEDKIYTVSRSPSEYLRKIAMKLLTMEAKHRDTVANNMTSNEGGPSNNPPEQASVDSTTQTAQPSGGVDSITQTAQPSGSVDSITQNAQPYGGDWQEEPYQKLQTMKENYLPDLKEMLQEITMRLQKCGSTPQQPKSDQIEKLKVYRMMLERIIFFLQLPKNSITLSLKEKLGSYEKQIVKFINSLRTREGISSLQPGQLPPTHISSMPQSQAQVTSLPSLEKQMISQMQPSNIQGSAVTLQQNNAASLPHNSMSGLSSTQQNMLNTIQPSNNVDAGLGNSVSSLQQNPVSSLQQKLQHSSPQVDQQTHQQSLAKVAPHLQSSNSHFVLVDSQKPVPGFSSSSAAAATQSLSIGTHGISALPLLAEFSGLDGSYFNAFAATSGKDFGKEFGKELLKEISSKKIEKLKKQIESVTMKMKLLILVLFSFWVSFLLFYKCM